MNKKTTALLFSAAFIAIYGVFAVTIIFGKDKGGNNHAQTSEATATATIFASVPVSVTIRPSMKVVPQSSIEATTTPYMIVKRDDKPLPVLVTGTGIPPAQDDGIPIVAETPNIEVDESQYFLRASDETPPAGFMIPKVKLVYNDGSRYGQYFHFSIENLDDYATADPVYSFRFVCRNYELLNRRQIMNANGTESDIFEVSRWYVLNREIYEQIRASGVAYVMPLKWYTTLDEEKTFILIPGMKFIYEFEITDGAYTMVFQKAFLLKDVQFK